MTDTIPVLNERNTISYVKKIHHETRKTVTVCDS